MHPERYGRLLLIYFIHHIAASVQADLLIQTVSKDVGRCLRKVLPTEDIAPDHTGHDGVLAAAFNQVRQPPVMRR